MLLLKFFQGPASPAQSVRKVDYTTQCINWLALGFRGSIALEAAIFRSLLLTASRRHVARWARWYSHPRALVDEGLGFLEFVSSSLGLALRQGARVQ